MVKQCFSCQSNIFIFILPLLKDVSSLFKAYLLVIKNKIKNSRSNSRLSGSLLLKMKELTYEIILVIQYHVKA